MTASVCLSQQPDREKVDLVCVLFPSYSHSPCLAFNWLFLSLLSLSLHSSAYIFTLSLFHSVHLSLALFLAVYSLVFHPTISVSLSVLVSPSLPLQRLCVCVRAWHGWHASIWKCSGDDIEHMWPQLAGWGLCGDHTVSLVAVRMPALQCKGGERRIRTDIIRLRKGERVKKEDKSKRWCWVHCVLRGAQCVCVYSGPQLVRSERWCKLNLAERPGTLSRFSVHSVFALNLTPSGPTSTNWFCLKLCITGSVRIH